MALTLYTIGHSNFTAEEFLETLRKHAVTVLVDVRSRPYSRYVPHFGKEALASFLTENGVEYRFAGQYLGGQPDDDSVYKTEVKPDAETKHEKYLPLVDYNLVMKRDWYLKGIKRLLEIIGEAQGNVAIMCSEGNPRDCHRHRLITRSLLDPYDKVVEIPIQIIHILRDGSLEPVDPDEFDKPKQASLFEDY